MHIKRPEQVFISFALRRRSKARVYWLKMVMEAEFKIPTPSCTADDESWWSWYKDVWDDKWCSWAGRQTVIASWRADLYRSKPISTILGLLWNYPR